MVLELCTLALDQIGTNLAFNSLHWGTQTQVILEVQALGYRVIQSVHHDYLLVIVHRFDTVND